MKWCKYAVVLSFFSFGGLASAQSADTLDIVGPNAGSWSFGWTGESYKGTAWCGDTTYKDITPDTVKKADTITSFNFINVTDTIIKGPADTQFVSRDTLLPDTQIVVSDSIIDSTTVNTCSISDFVSDSGGFIPGVRYINYFYKFRNSWAQLPLVWAGWAGWDSMTVAPYKYLLVVYKGLLPTHQMSLSFFYAAWGSNADSLRNTQNLGDGVGTLPASPDAWRTAVIQIPDSVYLTGITGLVFAIGNAPNQGGQTSDVGNLKIARISLLASPSAVRHMAASRTGAVGKFGFIPKTTGKVTLSVYSLKGELLCNKTFGVEANKQYSVRQMVQKYGVVNGAQMRLVKVQGAGVNMSWKSW